MEYIALGIAIMKAGQELYGQLVLLNAWINEAKAEGRDDITPEQVAEMKAKREQYKAEFDAEIDRLLAEQG